MWADLMPFSRRQTFVFAALLGIGLSLPCVSVRASATATQEKTQVVKAVQTDAPEAMTVDKAHETSNNKPYIGDMQTVTAQYEDTLLQIMRKNGLGYVEIRAANPDVNVWLPGEGTEIVLPTRHLLPDAAQLAQTSTGKPKGIIINLSEMRLYSFVDPENPRTFPIGVGREGLSTPTGHTKITRKKDGPSWRPTPRMRDENPDLPAVVLPGDDNPLGTHALYLGWPAYLIHGTHRPWGIGRRVSSGCIRMYPEHVVEFFDMIPVGTPVEVVKQSLKTAWIDDVLYLEAHADEDLADIIERDGEIKEYEVPQTLFSTLRRQAGAYYDHLDWDHIRTIIKERRGYPIAIFDSNEYRAAKEEAARHAMNDQAESAEAKEQKELEAAKAEAEQQKTQEQKARSKRNESKRGFN